MPRACRVGGDGVERSFDVFASPEPPVDRVLLEPDGGLLVCGLKGGPLDGPCFLVGPPGCARREGDRVRIQCRGEAEDGRAADANGDLSWEGCTVGPRW